MNASLLKLVPVLALLLVASLTRGFAAPQPNKALRVDHGSPVVVVSQNSVLLLEFVKESASEARVAHAEADLRHCRARYHFRSYDAATGSVTNGQGTVEEIYRVHPGPEGNQVEDAGSRVGISAGDFYLWWSEGTAGVRSWLNYRAESSIRFIQQPRHLRFDSVSPEEFRRYLASRNVTEYVTAGKRIQVLGPAVFAGEWPTDAPASGRIESVQLRDRTVELTLSGLALDAHYLIESSYEARSETWAPVSTFIAREPTRVWSEILGNDVDVMFYRIRQAPY